MTSHIITGPAGKRHMMDRWLLQTGELNSYHLFCIIHLRKLELSLLVMSTPLILALSQKIWIHMGITIWMSMSSVLWLASFNLDDLKTVW